MENYKINKDYKMQDIDFWDGVTVNGKKIKELDNQEDIRLAFLDVLSSKIFTSRELSKIFFNTQVYNDIYVNGIKLTTRGSHSIGVAITARELAKKIKRLMLGKSGEKEALISGRLAEILGYLHDLGHTPFGHDGESALNSEMERFSSSALMELYRKSRREVLGEEYTSIAQDAYAESMCYEHNEASAIIAERLILENLEDISKTLADEGIIQKGSKIELSKNAMQYIKTGILAHSTSRVKTIPRGIEQQAVRLADKVAYIPQDLLDLIKQDVISIDDLDDSQKALIGLGHELTEDERLAGLTIEEKIEDVDNLINLLRRKNSLSEIERKQLFHELRYKVYGMQVEIAKRCISFNEKTGEYELSDRKSEIDKIANTYNSHKEIDEDDISYRDTEGVKKYRRIREIRSSLRGITDVDEYRRKIEELKNASCEYNEFLQKTFGLDPLVSTLWVTKEEYEDSFIVGQLGRFSNFGREDLDGINFKNEHNWQIKAVFQYYYTHSNDIPKEFLSKYPKGQFTLPQAVSSFIASFTNDGLTELYKKLNVNGLVISRNQAMEIIQKLDPDIDIDNFSKSYIDSIIHSDKGDKTIKITSNDMLEVLYSKLTGEAITVEGERKMPEHRYRDIILENARLVKYRKDSDEFLKGSPESEKIIKQGYVGSSRIRKNKNAKEIVDSVLKRKSERDILPDVSEITRDIIRKHEEISIIPHAEHMKEKDRDKHSGRVK